MTKYPHIQQHDEKDCGAACLSMISSFYGLKLSIAKFRSLIKVDNQGANVYGIVQGAKQIGFEADALEGNLDELLDSIAKSEVKFPFIARILTNDGFEHFITVYDIKNDKVTVGDPAKLGITTLDIQTFSSQWLGHVIIFEPTADFEPKNETKGTFSKFFKYIFKQKKYIILVAVLSLVVMVVNMSGTIVFEYIVNTVTAMGGVHDDDCHDWYCMLMDKLKIIGNRMDIICLVVLGLYLLRVLFNICRSYLLALLSKHVSLPLVTDFYNHTIDLPFDFFGTRKSGELLSRYYNIDDINNAISTTVLTVMLDSVMAIFFGIALYSMNTTLFFITVAAMSFYALIVFLFRKPIRNAEHAIMEQDARTLSYFNETVHGFEFVKSFGYSPNAKNKFRNLFLSQCNKQVKGALIGSIQGALVNFVGSSVVIVLLWVGAYLCIRGTIELGELMGFYYMIDYFISPVANLINLQPTLQTAGVAAERLNDIFETEPENTGEGEKIDVNSIDIDNLSFRYGYRENVLNDISMHIKKGQKVAIVGESGCGKTTLAKLLMGFYEPLDGDIRINGESEQLFPKTSIRKSIAYISQNIFLLSDSVLNNLRAGDDSITDDEIKRVCKLCKADEFINDLPMGYDSVLEEAGGNLSAGQKQRLAIARALLRKPNVLIMDEATSNLDTVTETAVQDTIDAMSEDMTCIIIAHRLKTIQHCDYIYVMADGRIEEQGTHNELIEKSGLYAAFCDA